ncbi:MAG: hypothetical protein ACFFD2_02095 [Promethearchaeota archaeon]
MIHNLYIISESGIAIYSNYFVESILDEQLISGFLLAISNFATEAVGSGLKKIELQTGEQLHVYYDNSKHLTAAALTNAQDHSKLVLKILKKTLDKFYASFKHQLTIPEGIGDTSEFDNKLIQFLYDNTAKRDNKRFLLGLIFGILLLTLLYFVFWENFLEALINYFTRMVALFSAPPPSPDIYIAILWIFGIFVLAIEVNLIICFIPSAFLGGYIAGSRNKGKLLGLIFFLFTIPEVLIIMIIFAQNDIVTTAGFLYLFMLVIYIPLILITSITLSYLGGYLRDRRKLYPIPPKNKAA